MVTAIKVLLDGLAYGRFEDPAIKKEITNTLEALDRELTEENYDEGDDVLSAANDLAAALSASDSEKEAVVIPANLDEDDEFAGLGDDEDDEEKDK